MISSLYFFLYRTVSLYPKIIISLFMCFHSAIYPFSIMPYNFLCAAALRIIGLCCSSLTFLPSRVKSQILFALSVLLFYFFSDIDYISRVKESITGRDSVVREALEGKSAYICAVSFNVSFIDSVYFMWSRNSFCIFCPSSVLSSIEMLEFRVLY